MDGSKNTEGSYLKVRFKVWEAHGTKLNLLTVVLSLVPQFYNLASRIFSWNLIESGDLRSFTHKILFSPAHMVIFVMCLWLGCSSFVAAKSLFPMGNPGFGHSCHRRQEEEGILEYWKWDLPFSCVFCFGGKKLGCFLGKEVNYNEQDISIWNIHNSALTALVFLGINRILLLWFMSLLAHIPSSSPSFLAFLLQHKNVWGRNSGFWGRSFRGSQTGDVKPLWEQEALAKQMKLIIFSPVRAGAACPIFANHEWFS